MAIRHATALRGSAVFALALLLSLAGNGCSTALTSDGRVRVTFWHGMESGVNNRVLQAKIDEFNRRHPDVYVDAQIYGSADQLGPKLDAAVAGRTPPDLLWWAPAYFPKYADAGALESLDAFLASDTTFDRSDVYDFLWEEGTFQGHVYVTPFSANDLAVYYNKRMFADAGIERPPETWAEFHDVARRLTHDGVTGFQVPVGTSEWTVWTWECFLWQAGGRLLAPDQRSAAFDSEAGVAALDLWRAMLADGSAVFSETDAGYKTDAFLAGRVAMTINGPWNYASLVEQDQVEFGAFPLPRNETAATNIGGESLFLFKSNPRTERAAWEFMKFVMSPDFQVDWSIETGYLPVSKSAAADPRYRAFLAKNPFMRVYAEQMEVGRTRPSIPEYPAVSATLGKYLEAALYGKYSSHEALERAAREVNEVLQ